MLKWCCICLQAQQVAQTLTGQPAETAQQTLAESMRDALAAGGAAVKVFPYDCGEEQYQVRLALTCKAPSDT